jgi:hypothetical protein
MIAEDSAPAADLDELLARAAAAEQAGAYQESLSAVTTVVENLQARGKRYQYLYEWQARLATSLGQFDQAEQVLCTASDLARGLWHRPGVLRMTLARTRNAIAASYLERAEQLFTTVDAEPRAPASTDPGQRASWAAWLRDLHFDEHPQRNLAVLRGEAALTLAQLWAAREIGRAHV